MINHIKACGIATVLIVVSWICNAQPVATPRVKIPNVKIGVLTDMGSVFSDFGGPGSVIAAKTAIQDSGMADKVQLVAADHQNKPDIGAGLAREWFEQQGVDAIFDVPTSSVALAVNSVAGQDKKLVFFSTAIIDRITEEDCNGYGIAWT